MSLGSTRDETQTLPSIEDVATWMEFEGVAGTVDFRGVLPSGEVSRSDDALVASSLSLIGLELDSTDRMAGNGGGKGDIDMAVTDALL